MRLHTKVCDTHRVAARVAIQRYLALSTTESLQSSQRADRGARVTRSVVSSFRQVSRRRLGSHSWPPSRHRPRG
jgi:hypothetical protein